MQVDTVNVIEMVDDLPNSLRAFTENEDGNKQAEKLFASVIKENGCPEDDIEACTEDGIYEKGNYKAIITHST